jgi:hypothetical protein
MRANAYTDCERSGGLEVTLIRIEKQQTEGDCAGNGQHVCVILCVVPSHGPLAVNGHLSGTVEVYSYMFVCGSGELTGANGAKIETRLTCF